MSGRAMVTGRVAGDNPSARRYRARLLAAALALGAAGCPKPAPPSQFPSAAAAIERMRVGFACANGIQGEGKIDHLSARGRVRGEVSIFAVNPARVRIDVISPFGAMLYTLTSNGRDFRLLDTKQKTFVQGPASACNLARLTQVPVPGHALVALLRGEAPVLVHQAGAGTIAWQGDRYRLALPSSRQASEEIDLAVHPDDFDKPWGEQRLRVVRVQVAQRGQVLYTADLSDHELAHTAPPRVDEEGIDPDIPTSGGRCEVEIPRTIRLTVPHAGDDVVFSYGQVAFNPPIPEGAFSQPVPGGVRRQRAQCR